MISQRGKPKICTVSLSPIAISLAVWRFGGVDIEDYSLQKKWEEQKKGKREQVSSLFSSTEEVGSKTLPFFSLSPLSALPFFLFCRDSH